MISFDYYRVFCCAARLGSFTRAAEDLMTSQSSVSHTMAALERQLGCRLFLRTGRGIALTAEGRRLYEVAAAGCEQLRRAEAEITDTVNLDSGVVYLGATETAMRCFLIGALGRFHQQYPGIKFRITNGNSSGEAVEALRAGTVDLAIAPTPLDLRHPLSQRPLQRFQDVLVAGPQFAALNRQPLHLSELQDFPLICLARGTTTRDFLEALYRRHGLTLSADIEPATSDLVLPLVRENLGLGFVPDILAREALEGGEVFAIALHEAVPPRQVCLVVNENRPLSLAAEAFLRFLSAGSPGGEAGGG